MTRAPISALNCSCVCQTTSLRTGLSRPVPDTLSQSPRQATAGKPSPSHTAVDVNILCFSRPFKQTVTFPALAHLPAQTPSAYVQAPRLHVTDTTPEYPGRQGTVQLLLWAAGRGVQSSDTLPVVLPGAGLTMGLEQPAASDVKARGRMHCRLCSGVAREQTAFSYTPAGSPCP